MVEWLFTNLFIMRRVRTRDRTNCYLIVWALEKHLPLEIMPLREKYIYIFFLIEKLLHNRTIHECVIV